MKKFWITIAIIAIHLFIAFQSGNSEKTFKIIAFSLQLIGIWAVVFGIFVETRSLFGYPNLIAASRKVLRNWISRGSASLKTNSGIIVPALTCIARGHSSVEPLPNATSSERIQALETNVMLIHERINHFQNEFDSEFRGIIGALKQEQDIRASGDNKIRGMLESAEVSGIYISIMGAVWLTVGAVISTFFY
jgi:hypothetical protein